MPATTNNNTARVAGYQFKKKLGAYCVKAPPNASPFNPKWVAYRSLESMFYDLSIEIFDETLRTH